MHEKTYTSDRKMKIAIILESHFCSRDVVDFIEWAQKQPELQVSALIIQEKPSSDFIMRSFIQKAAARIERLLFYTHLKGKVSFDSYNISDYVETLVLASDYQQSMLISNQQDGAKIRPHDLDYGIKLNPGPVHTPLLNIFNHGLIDISYSGAITTALSPPGFWQVYKKLDKTDFFIRKYKKYQENTEILFKGSVATRFLFLLNQNNIYKLSLFYMRDVVMRLANGHAPHHSSNKACSAIAADSVPHVWHYAFYVLYLVRILIKKILNRLFFRQKLSWNVAFEHKNWKDAAIRAPTVIKNPPGHFLADPFVVEHEGQTVCFVEDYDYATSRGFIAAYALDGTNFSEIGPVIKEDFHMSYPYTFKYDSKIYMIPETSENKDIRLYVCEQFPGQWKFVKKLMSNISTADTTVFEKDGLWWLFTNTDPLGLGDHCFELNIFYADNPLADTWTPHAQNPILCDSMKGRMGGILYDGNSIIRVSQQQGFDLYGKSYNYNKIIELTSQSYKEETLPESSIIRPENAVAMHHCNSNGFYTVYDFIR